MDLRELNDEQLVELLKKDCDKAFEKLYLKYWQKLFAISYYWTKSTETSKELVQDVFISLWEKRHQLIIQTSLKGYLISAIKYAVYNYFDKVSIRERHTAALKLQCQNFDNATDEHIAFNELQKIYFEQLEGLPDQSKKIFRLSRIENYSIKEIAEKLTLSPKTVEYHITKALDHLRFVLKDYIAILIYILLL